MTQTTNRFFDESRPADERRRRRGPGRQARGRDGGPHPGREMLRDLDMVKREEFEAVKDMARMAREENEALKARIAALETKLGMSATASDVGGMKTDG